MWTGFWGGRQSPPPSPGIVPRAIHLFCVVLSVAFTIEASILMSPLGVPLTYLATIWLWWRAVELSLLFLTGRKMVDPARNSPVGLSGSSVSNGPGGGDFLGSSY